MNKSQHNNNLPLECERCKKKKQKNKKTPKVFCHRDIQSSSGEVELCSFIDGQEELVLEHCLGGVVWQLEVVEAGHH